MYMLSIYAVVLAIVIAIIRQLKGEQSNNAIREWLKNILISIVVALLIFYMLGWQPVMIAAAAYFADDILMAILEKRGLNEMVEQI